MKKIPMVARANPRSWRMEKSGHMDFKVADFAGGPSRLRMKAFDAEQSPRKMNARIRQLQPNPTPSSLRRYCSKSGKTIPPIPPAVVAIPVANPRLTLKKCAMDP
jgi:hypothetical protein